MNKKLTVVAVLALVAGLVAAAFPAAAQPCTTIRSGGITDAAGNLVGLGFDQYGYNYQAHLFVGTYDSVDRNLNDGQCVDCPYLGDASDPPVATFDDQLIMKWSDDWLANVDCNGDGKLDRGANGTSQGWLTNQATGDYLDVNGHLQHYSYFVKIVWVGPGGTLWGEYEIIQQVFDDPAGGVTGALFKPVAPGFGLNDQWTTP
jgi:hypothetical protein